MANEKAIVSLKFGSYTEEDAKADLEELNRGNASYYKAVVGRNVVRFLPSMMGKKATAVVHQHVIEVPGQQNPSSFNCPKMMAKRPCPACKKVELLRATGNPVDYQEAGKILAKIRVFANIIDRKNPEKGPQVFGYGKMIHADLVSLVSDKDAGGDYTHPIEGFDLVINREGEGMKTRYKVLRVAKNTPLAADAGTMQDWINTQPSLDKYMAVPSMQEMEKIFGGVATADEDVRQRSAVTRTPVRKTRTAEDDVMELDE